MRVARLLVWLLVLMVVRILVWLPLFVWPPIALFVLLIKELVVVLVMIVRQMYWLFEKILWIPIKWEKIKQVELEADWEMWLMVRDHGGYATFFVSGLMAVPIGGLVYWWGDPNTQDKLLSLMGSCVILFGFCGMFIWPSINESLRDRFYDRDRLKQEDLDKIGKQQLGKKLEKLKLKLEVKLEQDLKWELERELERQSRYTPTPFTGGPK